MCIIGQKEKVLPVSLVTSTFFRIIFIQCHDIWSAGVFYGTCYLVCQFMTCFICAVNKVVIIVDQDTLYDINIQQMK